MEEHFHETKRLAKETMRSLIKKSDNPALIQFTLMYLLFFASCVWVVFSWNRSWLELILSQLSLAIMCCSTFAALHETAHNTAFKSQFLNRGAAVLAGLAHLYASAMFRELHFTHHRYTHVPGKDPEISIGNKPIPAVVKNLPIYFAWLTGLPLLIFKTGMLINGAIGMPEFIRKKLYPFVRPKVRSELALESFFILAVYSGIVLSAIYIHNGFWGILVGQITGHCLLATYLTPEHNGLPPEGNILDRTRSMRTNKLVKLLMWNMPYHAEHHAYPAVPYHALPKLHQELGEEIKHKNLGYPDFHLKVLSREIK